MKKELTIDILNSLSEQYGDSYYILDSDVFESNYEKLTRTFKTYYPHFNIAYSYKTNYTPKLVQIVNRLNGFAEVVSDMELEIALRAGVDPSKIIWNGPVKNMEKVKLLLLNGGTVNVDSLSELDNICTVAKEKSDCTINIGLRCNYDVGDGVISRFGIDTDGQDYEEALKIIKSSKNVNLISLQAHFAKRLPNYWSARTLGLIKTYEKASTQYGLYPKWLDLGGGIYGEMPKELLLQLGIGNYSFEDYASKSASIIAKHFENCSNPPMLLIEPGTALAGNSMRFVCRVETIKYIRGKSIITAYGSQKNVSMTGINPPITIIPCGEKQELVEDADIVGYTCIEGDILQSHFTGKIAVGDYIVIENCGSYSLVMKPPFILPNFPVLDISSDDVKIVKRKETVNDILSTFIF